MTTSTTLKVTEMISTGEYDVKAITKYYNQQVKGAKKFGATEEQAISQAEALVRIYKHNFLIRVAA